MRFNALTDLLLALVPHFELLVVGNTCELIGVELIPRDIFHYLRVSVPLNERVHRGRQLIRLANVPQADFVVITARKQKTQLIRVPV